MALPNDFLHHLHELMVEVSDSLRESSAAHKQQLIFEAQRKNNSAAVLSAYSEAALGAFRDRAEMTIEKYIDAVDVWGLELNDSVEREILIQIDLLLSAPKHIDLPPALKHGPNLAAIQSSYGRELDRTANAIRRKAANRLREAKVRGKHWSITRQEEDTGNSMPTPKTMLPGASTTSHPRAFISYSWDTTAHSEWVRILATRLRADGVDVSIDQWSAIPGDQLPLFMEKAIRENEFVVIICTPRYRSRSEARQGGVGYEGDIMTAEVMASRNHRKFIPVLRSGSWEQAAPSWLAGKYYINLSGDPYSDIAYADLVRTLLGTREQAPPIGRPMTTIPRAAGLVASNQSDLGEQFEDIRVIRIIVEEVTEPRNDSTRGSALYSIPFALSRVPPSEWTGLFIENWNHPPRWTSMHRPGIARLSGSTIFLNGTTIEEVEKYHRDTLLLAVSESNKQYREWCAAQDRERAAEEALRQSHRARVNDASSRVKFD
jgi:hypothetical protein